MVTFEKKERYVIYYKNVQQTNANELIINKINILL